MTVADISVVILHYKQEEYLAACLRSVYATKYPFKEIIVVHNDVDYQAFKSIRSEFPDTKFVITGKNLGYAAGMNTGIRYAQNASPEFLLIMNCDTILEHDSVYFLVEALQNDPAAALATGTIFFYPDKNKIWYSGGSIKLIRVLGVHKNSYPYKIVPKEVTFISGCIFLARCSSIVALGGFDERYFMYYEDLDLCFRLQRAGYRLLYVPLARIYHRKTIEKFTPFALYLLSRNRFIFLHNCSNGILKIFCMTVVFIEMVLKAIIWIFYQPKFSKSIAFGIIDYMRGHCSIGRGDVFLRK